MPGKQEWRDSFGRKVQNLRSQWVKGFEQRLASHIVPAFDDLATFVGEHGFKASSPLTQPDRRSFKFELAENAYVLVTVRHESIEEVSFKCEYFAPAAAPGDYQMRSKINEIDRKWAVERFQEALDTFVDAMNKGGKHADKSSAMDLELLAV